MSKIRVFNILSNIPTVPDLQRFLSAFINELTQKFNGQIDFVDNIRAAGPYVVGFTNSSQVFSLDHTLNAVPKGFVNIYQTAAASIYAPQGSQYAWTSSTVFLQASAGVTASIYLI